MSEPADTHSTIPKPHWALRVFIGVGMTALGVIVSWPAAWAWWSGDVFGPLPWWVYFAALAASCVAHIAQASVAYRLTSQGPQATQQKAWTWQTLAYGATSLMLLKRVLKRRLNRTGHLGHRP